VKCPTCKGKGFLKTLQPIEPERLVFEDILGGFSSVRIVGEIVAVPCKKCGGRGKEWLDEVLDHGYNEE
jgi:hypothetical protein